MMKPCIDGIYFLVKNGECVYVGQSNDIYRRISEHRRGTSNHGISQKDFDSWDYIEVPSQDQKDKMESLLIHMMKPKYNMDYRIPNNVSPMWEKLKQIEQCINSANETIKFVERIERLERAMSQQTDNELVKQFIYRKVG